MENKICNKCGDIVGLMHGTLCHKCYCQQYYKEHKEEKSKRAKKYYQNNKNTILKEKRQYYDIHKAQIRLYEKTSSARQHYKKQHKNETIVYQKQYYQNNKQKCNERTDLYRRNIIVLEHISRKKLREMYNNKCAFCGQELNDKFHADHLLPVSRYEKIDKKCPHGYGNVAPTCPTCNLQKHAKTPLEFMWNKEVEYVY